MVFHWSWNTTQVTLARPTRDPHSLEGSSPALVQLTMGSAYQPPAAPRVVPALSHLKALVHTVPSVWNALPGSSPAWLPAPLSGYILSITCTEGTPLTNCSSLSPNWSMSAGEHSHVTLLFFLANSLIWNNILSYVMMFNSCLLQWAVKSMRTGCLCFVRKTNPEPCILPVT